MQGWRYQWNQEMKSKEEAYVEIGVDEGNKSKEEDRVERCKLNMKICMMQGDGQSAGVDMGLETETEKET